MKDFFRRCSALLMAAAMTTAMTTAVIPTTVIAEDEVDNTVTVKGYNDGIPTMTQASTYANDGTAVSVNEITQADAVAALTTQLAASKEAASKNISIASASDASLGIAKLTFDALSVNTAQAKLDVVLILDESGSMNMCSNVNGKQNISPDLNPDHYYMIPASCGFGNTEDIYFQLNTIGDGHVAFQPWNQSVTAWNKICEKFADEGLANAKVNTNTELSTVLQKWNPASNLYYKDVTGYHLIPQDDLGADPAQTYSSPAADNKYGCYDRMMVEKAESKKLVDQIVKSGANATVTVVTFTGSAVTRCTMTSTQDSKPATAENENLTAIYRALSNTNGGEGTNYEAGLFNGIQALKTNAAYLKDTTRKRYVVLISDGAPNKGSNKNAATLADKLNASPYNAPVYAVGINSGAAASLQNVARPNSSYAKDCATTDDFKNFIDEIAKVITNSSTLKDSIGDNYSLYIDADHPLTEDGIAYTNVNNLPDNVKYDVTTKTISWNIPGKALSSGERLSFFVKLNENKSSIINSSDIYETNNSASLTYKFVENGTVTEAKTQTLLTPKMGFAAADCTASLTSNQMTDNNPAVLGKMVSDDNQITYTITLKNNGLIDMANLVIKDHVPANTTYVSSTSNGVYTSSTTDNGNVVWKVSSLAAGASVSVSFTVTADKVLSTSAMETISNTFKYGWDDGTSDYSQTDPVCDGNSLTNPTPAKVTYVVNGDQTYGTPADSQTPAVVTGIAYDGSVTAAAKPATSWTTSDGTANGVPGTWSISDWDNYAAGTAITNIESNVTETAEWTFVPDTYKVTYVVNGDQTYGTPSDSGTPAEVTGIAYDGSVTAAAKPATSWTTSDGTANGVPGTWSISDWDNYAAGTAITNIESNVTETAEWTFVPDTYKVTYVVNGDQTYGTPADSQTPAVVTGIAYDGSVTAAAKPATSWTTSDGTANGIPGTWSISNWDNNAAGTTISGIKADVTETAEWAFVPDTYKVTYTVNEDKKYGAPSDSTTPEDVTGIAYGGKVTVPSLPSTKWTTSDGTEKGIPGTWSVTEWDNFAAGTTITDIKSDVAETAVWTFVPDTYKVTYVVNGDQTYGTPSDSETPAVVTGIAYDGSVTAALKPATAWTTSDGTANGVRGTWSISDWDNYAAGTSIAGIKSDITETASWTFTVYPSTTDDEEEKYSINTSVTDGSISSAITGIAKGQSETISYKPNEGYELKSVTVDGAAVDITKYLNSFTFSNISQNHTIAVVYGKIEAPITADPSRPSAPAATDNDTKSETPNTGDATNAAAAAAGLIASMAVIAGVMVMKKKKFN